MFKKAEFYKNLENNEIQCNLCVKRCIISKNGYGFCKSRKNSYGSLYLCNYPKVASYNVDPIEKKPLYHFLPGTNTFSIGGFGCNMSCLNCQNYMLSQSSYENHKAMKIGPKSIVKTAIHNKSKSISWTYNEPTMYFEYAKETSLIAHKNNLKNIYVSNGYMSEESLVETVKFIDAFNIDLKSMNNEFYRKVCGASLDPVLNNLKIIYKSKAHLEITNLLISKLNDREEELKELVNFIATELGKEVPIHFSRFFPMYKMENSFATTIITMEKAKDIAVEAGLENVYLGNMECDKNSYCSECGELLIVRNGFSSRSTGKIVNGKCSSCGHKLNFILE